MQVKSDIVAVTYNVRQRQSCHSERDRDSVVTVASSPCSLFDVFAVFSPPPLTATRSPAVYSWSLLLAAPARGPTRRPLFQRGTVSGVGWGVGSRVYVVRDSGCRKGESIQEAESTRSLRPRAAMVPRFPDTLSLTIRLPQDFT